MLAEEGPVHRVRGRKATFPASSTNGADFAPSVHVHVEEDYDTPAAIPHEK